MTTLLMDSREITCLILASGQKYSCFDGTVKRIEVYEELGQGNYVPWFAVRAFGGIVLARVNAAHVEEVRYEF